MLYIKKADTAPVDWEAWFTTAIGNRSYDYGRDQPNLPRLREARKFLLEEQNHLCAYCLQKISIIDSSIEHVIPKEFSVELSTSYTNLVAVCKNPQPDLESGKLHCDKHKLSEIITPFIFIANCQVTPIKNNAYFSVGSDGAIFPKGTATFEHQSQAHAYINTLNLNHSLLMANRAKDYLDNMIRDFRAIPTNRRQDYWEVQFRRIYKDKSTPFREILLIYISDKCGRH